MTPRNISKMSEHVAAIRKLVDDVHSLTEGCSRYTDPLLCRIKVECHVLQEHLKEEEAINNLLDLRRAERRA